VIDPPFFSFLMLSSFFSFPRFSPLPSYFSKHPPPNRQRPVFVRGFFILFSPFPSWSTLLFSLPVISFPPPVIHVRKGPAQGFFFFLFLSSNLSPFQTRCSPSCLLRRIRFSSWKNSSSLEFFHVAQKTLPRLGPLDPSVFFSQLRTIR